MILVSEEEPLVPGTTVGQRRQRANRRQPQIRICLCCCSWVRVSITLAHTQRNNTVGTWKSSVLLNRAQPEESHPFHLFIPIRSRTQL